MGEHGLDLPIRRAKCHIDGKVKIRIGGNGTGAQFVDITARRISAPTIFAGKFTQLMAVEERVN
jgi:hypothetical protein